MHKAQLMLLPLTISCSSKSRLVYLPSFTFLVPAHQVVLDKIQEGRKIVVFVVCDNRQRAVLVYRPSSQAVTDKFFDELKLVRTVSIP